MEGMIPGRVLDLGEYGMKGFTDGSRVGQYHIF